MDRFGIALRRERAKRKLTQEQLADRAGMSRTYLTKIETGGVYRPEDETIERLATALGMTADELLVNVEPPLMLREDRALYAVDIEEDDLLRYYNRMSAPDRKRLVVIAEALFRASES